MIRAANFPPPNALAMISHVRLIDPFHSLAKASSCATSLLYNTYAKASCGCPNVSRFLPLDGAVHFVLRTQRDGGTVAVRALLLVVRRTG